MKASCHSLRLLHHCKVTSSWQYKQKHFLFSLTFSLIYSIHSLPFSACYTPKLYIYHSYIFYDTIVENSAATSYRMMLCCILFLYTWEGLKLKRVCNAPFWFCSSQIITTTTSPSFPSLDSVDKVRTEDCRFIVYSCSPQSRERLKGISI